jgi:hypothetical protein
MEIEITKQEKLPELRDRIIHEIEIERVRSEGQAEGAIAVMLGFVAVVLGAGVVLTATLISKTTIAMIAIAGICFVLGRISKKNKPYIQYLDKEGMEKIKGLPKADPKLRSYYTSY